ncbi:MAG TPA: hypothetical protein VGD65_25860 [Chryseosolibacter sp.]
MTKPDRIRKTLTVSHLLLFTCSFLNLSCEYDRNNWYTSRCQLLCIPEEGRYLSQEKLLKYKDWYPYDTLEVINDDSATVSFDFIADCCLDFAGSAAVERDTLLLTYGYASDTLFGCDCSCDYRMIYQLKTTNKQWSAIKILNKDGEKPY